MPTYEFKCHIHGEFEDLVPIDSAQANCPTCGKASDRLFTACLNIHIPAWMSATNSYASDKQAVYLKSDKHRQRAAKNERAQEAAQQREDRIAANRQQLSKTIEARVEDNARYSDQSPQAVVKRAKEYCATKFAS